MLRRVAAGKRTSGRCSAQIASKKKEIDKTGNLNVGEGNISLNIGMQEVLASVFLICKRHFLEKNLVEL